jgi:hypothetical protein
MAQGLVLTGAGVWTVATLLSLVMLIQPGPAEFLGRLLPVQQFLGWQIAAVIAAGVAAGRLPVHTKTADTPAASRGYRAGRRQRADPDGAFRSSRALCPIATPASFLTS